MHSSREMSEWMAYEKAFGPIDDEWRDSTLAEIHELLQHIRHINSASSAQNGTSPETIPQHKTRPHELYEEYKRRLARGDVPR